ncbi:BirA family transcriptional regulator, biotin operon repressor / biotin-[acetyl-CoA-carboxylase] ligase [Geoalkalibacter ferrihydriticus]|uniref:Bifunctional ligase/repressor BirA n=2 Tax=Geoalkalibacter ferrihydriticus TaxID=392333 RepID=A0A0C2ECU2_9BACT|nr:biotin--[acetyl-CoA-carboxylase] ligase [Geoalkalibacter ferrihydriticus]KIH76408.1 biotin--acetyl-CoA carboxylase ligase [Geoalkalibacter ferrihydriticus DSM 17813]SDL92957.1 BirA family transcriptional regulator, biotin operon repressor / biotin-[acetyl-CoA-carboxylase] ligase [Geoalkalibacter ferrihydriticus]
MVSVPHSSQNAVLALLREQNGACVSGAELSRRLGVSRTAIWKQIGALRLQGYRIEAAPSRGYRLLGGPDLVTAGELQAGLKTALVGRNLVYFAETDSTNIQAQRAAEEGAADGTVVVADSQSAGKGRMGRRWTSPAGVNLYTSVLLRPAVPPLRAPQLTFVAALAVARTIREHCGLPAEVKWPNDILLDGCKVAGLLSEMSAESERIHYVVLGMGLNVNMDADQFPADLRYPATSLKLAAGHGWDRAPLARHLYRLLEEIYQQFLDQGFAPIARQWEELCPWSGRAIEVDRGVDCLRGTFAGIDENGALLLDIGSGSPIKIYAGDVRPID